VRTAVLTAAGELEIAGVPDPERAPGTAVLDVVATGICGSDLDGARGDNDRRRPGRVMGHEIVATDAGGDRVVVNPLVACGTCAACRAGHDNRCPTRRLIGCVPALPGGFADRLAAPAANLVPFGGAVPAEWGALVEPLAVGVHAVDRLPGAEAPGRPPDGPVLVVGGGMIGVACALAARARGADVAVSEPVGARRALLTDLGLTALAPDDVGRERYGSALDCVASAATLATALDAVTTGGAVVVVGFGRPELSLPLDPVVQGEKTVTGSAQYPAATYAATAQWVASGAVDLAPVIGARVALEALPDAFAELLAGADRGLKVLVTPR
jgi:2-desacetyl-2-hydroxyethyl bacteriochlorophyllide A dehydrogenase